MSKPILTTAMVLAGGLVFAACSPKSEAPAVPPAPTVTTAPAAESGAMPSPATTESGAMPSGSAPTAKPASQGGGDKI